MANFQDALFDVPGYHVRQLQPEDMATLQDLLERCSDYNELVTGLPPGPADAYALLTDAPPGKTPDEKHVIGFFTAAQNLIGVLDFVRDYPAQGDWWIGLLLLDPAHRGQGFGQHIFRAFAQWAKQQSAQRIYLGVVEANQKAYRFWQTVGFEVVERRPPKQFGAAEHVVIVMANLLS